MAQKLIAPSRGLMRQFILRGTIPQAFFVRGHCRYASSRAASKFIKEATNPDNKSQIYISRTQNPFINLSIEHYLLQKTPADSTILFLYTNENSIVLGRNQNVWNEVNLHAVRYSDEKISLVRRRSGGGTVFHDAGNVNYCVIFPTSEFDRDRHAEMVVRALHKLGVTTAVVNARHDIVLQKTDPNTPTRKVSGSAYKVTRERSLHHGTCLLSSPNLRSITDYLRSPAKRFIKSRGVESVGSAISNAKVKSNKAFEDAVVKEFNEMYGHREPIILTEAVKEVPEIVKGIKELTSPDWIFSQTPQFTFTTEDAKKVRKKKPLPAYLPPEFKASFTARNGIILEAEIEYRDEKNKLQKFGKEIVDQKIHEIEWNKLFPNIAREPLKFLSKLFSNKPVH